MSTATAERPTTILQSDATAIAEYDPLAAESEAKTRAEKAGPALLSHLVQITTAYDLGDFPSLGEAIDSARLTVIDATL